MQSIFLNTMYIFLFLNTLNTLYYNINSIIYILLIADAGVQPIQTTTR